MAFDAWVGRALSSPLGHRLEAAFGLPEAVELRRGRRLPTGPIVFAVLDETPGFDVHAALERIGVLPADPLRDLPSARRKGPDGRESPPAYAAPIGGVVLDVTGARRVGDLERIRAVLRPAMRSIEPSGRVILVGLDPARVSDAEAAAVQQGLDGLMRTIGKELRQGATCNLVQVDPEQPVALEPALSFLLEGRSAYVDGQPLRLTGPRLATLTPTPDTAPAGRVVVVTGAARGIGAAIARRFADEGARLLLVDVATSGDGLAAVANDVRGTSLQLDITAPDAGRLITELVTDRFGSGAHVGVLVHCAGILRDKLLANLDDQRWAAVLEVNLAAQLRMNQVMLEPDLPGSLADGGRVVAIASTSGWAGNRGQANYATSKAGVMGMVRALAPALAARGIAVNAVAPGFIDTAMTATIPALEREVFKRTNSLSQAGKPTDVAEAVAFLAEPANPMTGQILRVCGQLMVGA